MRNVISAAERFHRLWAVASFLLVVGRLLSLRGIEIGAVLLFVIPPAAAFLAATRAADPTNRLLGNFFLTAIVVGQIVAPFPGLFPKLGGVEPKLGPVADRTLTWYVEAYLLYFCVVMPTRWAVGQLRRHARGEPAGLSLPVSVLVLVAAASVGVPVTIFSFAFLFLGFAPPA
ncbi:MAG TPA: hypothetical protein VF170_10385 [Planctomycetaceae bacterium]